MCHNGELVMSKYSPIKKDINIFMESCTILNDTLAWDIVGDRNESKCIDIDPDTLYNLPESVERIA